MRRHAPKPLAVLVREVPVRLLDLSLSGCLLESRERLQSAAAGRLLVHIGGRTRFDDVRISRCVQVEGAGLVFRVGADFLRLHRLGEQSLRDVVRMIQDGERRPGQPLIMPEGPGSNH